MCGNFWISPDRTNCHYHFKEVIKVRNKHRFLALALTAILAVSAFSAAAAAESPTIRVYQDLFKSRESFFDSMEDRLDSLDVDYYNPHKKNTIKASQYDDFIVYGDDFYERVGMNSTSSHTKINNKKKEMVIPPYPEDGTELQQKAWMDKYADVTVAYALHEHDLRDAPWFFDNNYHWKYCKVCGHRAFLRWHSDRDEDGNCDLCGNPIHTYDIQVKESAGGKVNLSAEKGPMNMRVDVTVTPDPGYHLQNIRFFNHNEKHSQLTRWEDRPGEAYHFVILNWDIDVEAEFVKD